MILILILTSSNIILLEKSINSILNQEDKLDYKLKIIVNTLNDDYYYSVYNKFNLKFEIIRTKSNGKPGMGHNSLINIFKKQTEYEYMIPIDGDDFLYPTAFEQYKKLINETPDIVHLITNDYLFRDNTDIFHIKLKNNYKLITHFGNDNLYKLDKSIKQIGNPYVSPIYDCTTPLRIILVSRNIFKMKIPLLYGEDLTLYDDYIPFLNILYNHHNDKNIKMLMISDPNIYFYNKLNETSASHTFSERINEDNMFRKYLKKFPELNITDLKELDFFKLSPPNNFNIENKINFCNELIDDDIKNCIKLSRDKNKIFFACKFIDNTEIYDYDILYNIITNGTIQMIKKYGKIFSIYFDSEKDLLFLFNKYEEVKLKNESDNIYKLLKYNYPEKYKLEIKKNKIIIPEKKILCYYVGESHAFNGKNYQEKNVWGSEIAAVNLCENLTNEYEVFIINNCDKEIKYNNVTYLHMNNFNYLLTNYSIDTLIISRFTHAFFLFNFNNVKNIYFLLHDSRCHELINYNTALPNLGIDLFLNQIKNIKKVICVSNWQKNNMLERFKDLDYNVSELRKKIIILPNGINLKNFQDIDFSTKNKYRFIYHSDPSRGLLKLCNIIIRLQKIYKDVKLDIYFSHISDEEIIKLINEHSFINFKGKVSNNKICNELKKTGIWLYPNINSHETFCIAALEAIAAGNMVMGLNYSGVGELISKVGLTFNKESDDEIYIKRISEVYENDKLLKFYQEKSVKYSLDFSWKNISDKLINIFN